MVIGDAHRYVSEVLERVPITPPIGPTCQNYSFTFDSIISA
jgi:hypothetical protein